MPDIKTIADKADIIINGYAFTREDDGIHVLNLKCDSGTEVPRHGGTSTLNTLNQTAA